MARCDQGYLCKFCGDEVEALTDSSLYLQYVIGDVDPELLHLVSDCHLQCNPALAQFISDPRLGPLRELEEPFRASQLDPAYVSNRVELVSRGYRRLWEIRSERHKFPSVREYPLPEVLDAWRAENQDR